MAQKDKVKELVGRGLGSYHTKSLQQIDRIERKNKEQNHKINILTSELDNDYLTKTEEGSVVSLEHSKEGMVYLDELQGNTLVNYCTDGAKELTLNGDIDVEGTNVTLTEGVDNGKVDVVCEGNTLVNLSNHFIDKEKTFTLNSGAWYNQVTICDMSMIKLNVDYTLIYDIEVIENNTTWVLGTNTKMVIGQSDIKDSLQSHPTIVNSISNNGKGTIIWDTPCYSNNKILFNINTWNTSNSKYFSIRPIYCNQLKEGESIKYKIKNLILLEGNWTNKEIPKHFNGMKSVGELEDNKIEILSNNGSLIDFDITKASKVNCSIVGNSEKFTITTDGSASAFKYIIFPLNYTFKKGVTYTFNAIPKKIEGTPKAYVRLLYKDNTIEISNQDVGSSGKKTFTPTEDITDMRLWFYGSFNNASQNGIFEVSNVIISLDNNLSYRPYALNKKEISLNEPLRGLPNGVKDKIVKIGGKWYVERNCYKKLFDGTEGWKIDQYTDTIQSFLYTHRDDKLGKLGTKMLSDKLPYKVGGLYISNEEGCSIGGSDGDYLIYIKKSKLGTVDVAGLKQWLNNNPLEVVYQLVTPIYEPLEIEPTLSTYNDITHISANSTIPSNMKIQNSGYNAIIKPSTLYTVALDTNKNGTIGINLGGAKVTTNNNVATITTPATLTDDSLRLHGKGIKASKVRLLEGDKTNWIPSYFEGMQSSFEDKLQEDGTFKMEILSNNGNLINLKEQVRLNKQSGMNCSLKEYNGVMSWEIHTQPYIEYYNYLRYQYKPNTQYTMYFDCNMTPYDDRTTFSIIVMYENGHIETFSMNKDTKNVQFTTLKNRTVKKIYFSSWQYSGYVNIYNMKFCEGSGVLVEEKSNKIQFSSIEPLRGVGDIKDKFVFKDGKLMIERNCGHYIFNENTPWIGTDNTNKGHWIRVNDDQIPNYKPNLKPTLTIPSVTDFSYWNNNDNELEVFWDWMGTHMYIFLHSAKTKWNVKTEYDESAISDYMKNNPIEMVYELAEPTYEEIPFELQKIILEGYENGTLFFDTNMPPTVTVTYAGETPIVKSVKLNKTEVLNNTNDINDNIVPYLMDMDYRVVCLQLESGIENVSMARLFGGTYEMLQRDILSNRYSKEEYKYRLDAYLSANKITQDEYTKLGDMLND